MAEFKPRAAGSSTPVNLEDALEPGEGMVTCVVPNKILLTLDDHRRITILPGVREIPEHIAGKEPDGSDMHWYLRQHGVQRHGGVRAPMSAVKVSSKLPAAIDVGRGKKVSQSELADAARERLEMTVAEWNELDESDIEKEITAQVDLRAAGKKR